MKEREGIGRVIKNREKNKGEENTCRSEETF